MITAVAYKVNDELIVGLPKERHSDLYLRTYTHKTSMHVIFGFVDEKGNWYDREAAAKHAFECHQIDRQSDLLISEQLW